MWIKKFANRPYGNFLNGWVGDIAVFVQSIVGKTLAIAVVHYGLANDRGPISIIQSLCPLISRIIKVIGDSSQGLMNHLLTLVAHKNQDKGFQ